MKSSLMDNFGEACYGSCGLMDTKREAIVHIKATIGKLTEKEYSIYAYLFRYFLIMLIGSAPLLILIKKSKLTKKIFNLKKIVLIFDECTSGFRQTYGGLHKKYDVEPDMMMLGKKKIKRQYLTTL